MLILEEAASNMWVIFSLDAPPHFLAGLQRFQGEISGWVDIICHFSAKFWKIMDTLHIKAGKIVYDVIRDGGLDLDRIATYVGPAVGPRWLVASGFDLALLKNKVLGKSRPLLLVGSSAGAWRFAAWPQPEPVKSYRNLMDAYISTGYNKNDTPLAIQQSIRNIIDSYLEDDAIPFALTNKRYRLAIVTARARNIAAFDTKLLQWPGLALCFLLNAMNRSSIYGFFQRVVFYSGYFPPHFCLENDFNGEAVQLNEANFKAAVLASGAIPLVVAGVKNIYGAPNGVYRDGGLTDYNLNNRYATKDEDIALLFHHQERIIPGWLDKKLKYRRLSDSFLENVMMVYPSENLVLKFPGGKIPDREDFKIFIDDPGTRIKNWRRVVDLCADLGDQFLELVESKKIRHIVERM